MAGHVFHPGHHQLHGVTVVLETKGSHTYIGRFDTEDEAGAHLLDVAVHDPHAGQLSKEEFVRRTLKFGCESIESTPWSRVRRSRASSP